MDQYLLAFDIGTSAVKASIVSEKLEIIDSVEKDNMTYFPAPLHAEQDAEEWWVNACAATQELLQLRPEAREKIGGIGVSGHMLGLLAVDGQGNPLRRHMIHADNRAREEAAFLRDHFGARYFSEKAGIVLSSSSCLSKALWFKNREPELYAKTARFLQSKDYLVYKLTGNLDSTDYSDTSHGDLLDVRKKVYLTEEFREIGLDPAKFPTIHRSMDVVGKLTGEAAARLGLPAGIPVVAGGGDGSCASAGAGIVGPGETYCSLGTTAWVSYNSAEPFIDEKDRVFTILSLDGEVCGTFGTMQCAGRSLNWSRRLFGIDSAKEFDVVAAQAPAGSSGLIFLPYLEGERSPIFDPQAKGVYYGMTLGHRKEHFARAVLEGVACGLASMLAVLREQAEITEMRIIGGGAKSRLWKQIIADICNVTICDVSSSATGATSLGAAAAAAVGVGVYPDIQTALKQITVSARTAPIPENREVSDELLRRYLALYPALKPIYHM